MLTASVQTCIYCYMILDLQLLYSPPQKNQNIIPITYNLLICWTENIFLLFLYHLLCLEFSLLGTKNTFSFFNGKVYDSYCLVSSVFVFSFHQPALFLYLLLKSHIGKRKQRPCAHPSVVVIGLDPHRVVFRLLWPLTSHWGAFSKVSTGRGAHRLSRACWSAPSSYKGGEKAFV